MSGEDIGVNVALTISQLSNILAAAREEVLEEAAAECERLGAWEENAACAKAIRALKVLK